MTWEYIVAYVSGGALAIAGGYLAQTRADRAAEVREARARDHEREVWARGLRHEVHIAYLAKFDERYKTVQEVALRPDRDHGDPPDDFLTPVWERFESVRLVCTAATATAGERAFQSLMAMTFRDGAWEQVEIDRDQYLATIREEFGLPAVPAVGEHG